MTRRLGVVGWPVSHSRSPAIQNAALAAVGLGEQWRYQLLPVPPAVFEETVQALPALGFHGVNVTIPHKAVALVLARASGGEISERAAAIGAANTLVYRPGRRIAADNTDAPALIAALSQRLDVGGCSALVLGAGGSARAAVWALVDAGAREVHVWNRTAQRAADLAAAFGARTVENPSAVGGADVLVNCTSVGLHDGDRLETLSLSPEQLRRHRVAVDFAYRADGTPLTRTARELGIPTIDGLELLVGQGALAFELFTGVPAPLGAMRLAVGLSSAR